MVGVGIREERWCAFGFKVLANPPTFTVVTCKSIMRNDNRLEGAVGLGEIDKVWWVVKLMLLYS